MNRIIPAIFCLYLFSSCGKDNVTTEPIDNNTITLTAVKVDRELIGLNQEVTLSIEKPVKGDEVVIYKWTIKDAEGVSKDFVVYTPSLDYAVKTLGKHDVTLNISVGNKSGSSKGSFESKSNDFGLAIFGNSSKIIKDAKLLEFTEPETGLSGYYWPYSSTRPEQVLRFKKGNVTENYFFNDDKFIGGSKEVYDVNALTSTNGVNRFLAYSHFESFAIVEGNKVFSSPSTINIEWKSGITNDQKSNYETKYTTKYDGYGVALYNRDVNQLSASWSDNIKEATAVLTGNSKYTIQYVIRKR